MLCFCSIRDLWYSIPLCLVFQIEKRWKVEQQEKEKSNKYNFVKKRFICKAPDFLAGKWILSFYWCYVCIGIFFENYKLRADKTVTATATPTTSTKAGWVAVAAEGQIRAPTVLVGISGRAGLGASGGEPCATQSHFSFLLPRKASHAILVVATYSKRKKNT